MNWTSTLPRELMLSLVADYGLKNFVETGTQSGDTVLHVEPYFEQVHTIEVGVLPYLQSRERLAACPRVKCWFGSSPGVLAKILPLLAAPTLFWLDAHYSGPGTCMLDCECPLMAELAALRTPHGVIVIDDARMFYGDAIGKEHDRSDWPSFQKIEAAIHSWGWHIVRIDDALVVTPRPNLSRATKKLTDTYQAWGPFLQEVLEGLPK